MTAIEKAKRRWKVTKGDYQARIADLESQVRLLTDERDQALSERGLRAFFPKRMKRVKPHNA